MSSKKPKKLIQKRLDGVEWRAAELLYQSGDWTQEAIAKKYGITANGVYQHMRKYKIVRGAKKEQFAIAAEKQMSEKMAEVNEELLEDAIKSKRITVKTSVGIQNYLVRLIKKVTEEGKSLTSVGGEVKVANEMLKALGQGWTNVSVTLGLDKHDPAADELEVLTLHNLTDEGVAEIRRQQEEELAIMNGKVSDGDVNLLEQLEEEDIELEDGE